MERGVYRFTVGLVLGLLWLAGRAEAQQAGSYVPVEQLTAAMLGQPTERAVVEEGVVVEENVDPTESKPLLGLFEGVQAKGSLNVAWSYNFNESEGAHVGGVPVQETPTRIFDTYHNEFTVHNLILYLEKPVDSENLLGFAFTPTVGKDSAVTQDPNLSFGGNDLDVLQLNLRIYTPDDVAILGGTTFEIGKFLTNVGMEVIDAPYNAMFSRTWLMGLAQPFVHTGVRGTKTVIERDDGESLVDVSLGIANGWGNHGVGSFNPATTYGNGNFPTWLTTATLSPGGPLDPSLTVNYLVGETSAAGKYRNLIDVVASLQLVENLTLSGNLDWVGDEFNNNVAAVNPALAGYSQLWGLAGIVRYDFGVTSEETDWYLAFRGEYFDNGDQWAAPSGLSTAPPADLYSLTWTLGYKPFNNLLLRTELRYDKAGGGSGGKTSNIFENGKRSHQTTLSFDVSLLF